jgi:hypothetical protein
VADKNDKDSKTAKPGFDPKPVQLGGESLLDRLLPHMKKIMWSLIAIAVLLSVYFTIAHFQDAKKERETRKLQDVLSMSDHPIRAAAEQAGSASTEVTFGDNKERANAVLDKLAKAGTDAGGPTYRGAMLVQAGKLDDAIAEYKRGITKPGLEGVIAREGLGIATEMKATSEKDPAAQHKGLEEALADFKAMQLDPEGPRYAYALYHQGRLLGPRMLNRPDEAKAVLEKAKEAGKGTEVGELAQQQIASMGG